MSKFLNRDEFSYAMDQKLLRERAKYFGYSLGLVIPERDEVVDSICTLYVSRPDKIESVIKGERGRDYESFGPDISGALEAKSEFDKCGYHTHITKAKGDAGGRMAFKTLSLELYLMILFHEGFHNNPNNKMNLLVEEPGARLMGYETSIQFLRLFGPTERIKKAYNLRNNFERSCERFLKSYEGRLTDLRNGKSTDANCIRNNAFMLAWRANFLHYDLIKQAFKKIGNLGETRATLSGLPFQLKYAVRRLEGIVSED